MLEVFSWIASVAAVIWARKQDIVKLIDDPYSRKALSFKLTHPHDAFRVRVKTITLALDRYLESGIRTFFFCLMAALIYSSMAFMFNMAIAKNNLTLLGISPFPAWKSQLIFLLVISTSMICFSIARLNAKPRKTFASISSANNFNQSRYMIIRKKYILINIASAIFYSWSIYYVYRNIPILFLSIVVSFGCTLISTPRLGYQQQFTRYKASIAFGSALGAHGLLIVLLFFAAKSDTAAIIISVGTLTCLLICIAALVTSRCITHEIYARNQHAVFEKISLLCRSALFVGFYCSRAPGSFCAAVAIVLTICNVISGYAPNQLVVPASVVMTASVFLAGATSLAGAGGFAFFVMLIVTICLMIYDPSLIFTSWSFLVLFWFIFPLTNAIFDYGRWTLLRRTMSSHIKRQLLSPIVFVVLDLLFALIAILGFVALTIISIIQYNKLSTKLGHPIVMDVETLISLTYSDFSASGIWVFLLIGTILLPTILNLLIFLLSGIMRAVPLYIRQSLSQRLDRMQVDDSLIRKDRLAWQIAACDALTGVVFFISGSIAILYAFIWLGPAFGELLHAIALWLIGLYR